MHDWDNRFIDLAKHIANWSKDPKTKVGAVIVDDEHRIISVGYNGFPRNVYDDPNLLIDRDSKLKRIIHAEANAIINARCNLSGMKLYTTLTPCAQCAGFIIQSGIKIVYSPYSDIHDWQRWQDDFQITRNMFKQSNVRLEELHELSVVNCE